MNKVKKQVLAVLMVITMCLSIFPSSAFAGDQMQIPQDSQQNMTDSDNLGNEELQGEGNGLGDENESNDLDISHDQEEEEGEIITPTEGADVNPEVNDPNPEENPADQGASEEGSNPGENFSNNEQSNETPETPEDNGNAPQGETPEGNEDDNDGFAVTYVLNDPEEDPEAAPVTAQTLSIDIAFGERAPKNENHPESVLVTPSYTVDGENWIAMDPVTVTLSNRVGTATVTLPQVKNEEGEILPILACKVEQDQHGSWETIYKPVLQENDGNFNAVIRNYKPIAIGADIEWVNEDANKHVDPQNGNLILHPVDNEIKGAVMRISFSVDGSSDQSIPIGAVQFTLPSAIFKNRNEELGYMAYDNSSVQIYSNASETPAPSSSFIYKKQQIDGREYYVFTNYEPMSTADFYVDITYHYRPSQVAGGYVKEGTFGEADAIYAGNYFQTVVDVPIQIDANKDGQFEFDKQFSLSCEVHTKVTAFSTFKKQPASDANEGMYLSWQSSWGDTPEDAAKYFYVVWSVDMIRSKTFNQPFDVTLSEINSVTIKDGAKKGGTWAKTYSAEMIGAWGSTCTASSSQGGGQFWSWHGNNVSTTTSYSNIASEGWEDKLTFPGFVNVSTISSSQMLENSPSAVYTNDWSFQRKVYILMRYPMQALEDAEEAGVDLIVNGITIPNTVSYQLDGVDGWVVKRSTTSNTTLRLDPYDGGSLFEKTYGVAQSQNEARLAGVRLANGRSAALGNILDNGYAYKLTVDAKSPVEPTTENGQAAYPYTYTLEDGYDCYLSTFVGYSAGKTLDTLTDPIKLDPDHGDYYFTSLYLTCLDYNAVHETGADGSASWTVSGSASQDYTRIQPVVVYVRKAGGEFYPYAEIKKSKDDSGTVIYTAYQYGTTTSLGLVSSASYLALPEETVGIRVSHTTDFFESKLTMYLNMTLNPTQGEKGIQPYMQRLYEQHKEGWFTNLTNLTVTQNGNTSVYTQENSVNQHERSIKLGMVFPVTNLVKTGGNLTDDPANTQQKRHIVIRVTNFTYNTHAASTDKNDLLELGSLLTSGVIYDLLPAGTTVDLTSVRMGVSDYNHTISSTYAFAPKSVRVDTDWEGSGRSMLIVEFDTPTKWLHYYARLLEYDLINSYTNISDRGTDVINTMAFVNTGEQTKVAFGSAYNLSGIKEKDLYSSLYEQYKGNIGFTQYSVPFDQVGIYQDSLVKQVSSSTCPVLGNSSVAYFGETYTYRLAYGAPINTTVSDIILIDVLDNNRGSQWQGTLSSVDLSMIKSKITDGGTATCNPVVYYSSVIPTVAQMKDMTDPIWSTERPEVIGAIAIDCRYTTEGTPFVLQMKQTLAATLTMKAPDGPEAEALVDKTALNIVYSFNSMTVVEPLTKETSIVLKPAQLSLTKHASYDGTADDGTEDDPVDVANLDNQTITYTLTVTNDSTQQTYSSVIVKDPIPEGLTVDLTKVMLTVFKPDGTKSVNNKAVNSTSGYNVQMDENGNLLFTIARFLPGYQIVFTIPAVQKTHVEESTEYINTAEIISVNNREEHIGSDTTYHEVDPAVLTVSKSVAGNGGDKDKEFTFTIQLGGSYKVSKTTYYGKNLNGTYGDVTFTNGVATFTLKDGESVSAKGLPVGFTYTVTEADYSADGYVTTYTGSLSGTFTYGVENTIEFTNTRNLQDLTIEKVWDDNNDQDDLRPESISVQIMLLTYDKDGNPVSETYGDPVVITEEDDWKATVAVEEVKYGMAAVYYLVETEPTAYTATYSPETITFLRPLDLEEEEEEIGFKITITNTHIPEKFGDLKITKIVQGNACDTSKLFGFTITLSDTSINGTYGDMTFENGVAHVSLSHNMSAVAKDLPNKVEYTVTEDEDTLADYEPETVEATGTIIADQTQEETFINIRNAAGTLMVLKLVKGNDGDKTKEFNFKITMEDTTIDGTFSGIEFVEGVATFTLKDGESVSIEGLPNGAKYTVEEDDYSADGYVTTSVESTGAISELTAANVIFTNTRDTFGNLTVTKSVAGNEGDKTKAFTFTVTLSDITIDGVFGDMTFVKGVATFTLKDGESKTAKDLPNGVTFTVKEADYSQDGYETKAEGASGAIVGGKTQTASFTNTKDVPPTPPVKPEPPEKEVEGESVPPTTPIPETPAKPNTGDLSNPMAWLIVMLVAVAGIKIISDYEKKRREE